MQDQTNNIPVQNEKENEVSYGKFKTAEDLFKAYTALESEFTKRSQKLKEFENAAKANDKWEAKIGDLVARYPVAEKFTDELAEEIASDGGLIEKENCLENALLRVLSKKVKTEDEMATDAAVKMKVLSEAENQEIIIREYIESLKKNKVPAGFPKGGATPAASAQITTMSEASEIARKFIDSL